MSIISGASGEKVMKNGAELLCIAALCSNWQVQWKVLDRRQTEAFLTRAQSPNVMNAVKNKGGVLEVFVTAAVHQRKWSEPVWRH